MIDQSLVSGLGNAHQLPDALARAAANPDTIVPAVLDVLNHAADGATLSDEQANLLAWGIHVVALTRDRQAYGPLMRVLRGPEREFIFGDIIGQTMPQIVVSVFDGSPAPIFELLADPTLDGYVRWTTFDALTYLTLDGLVAPSETEAFLVRFDDERLAEPGDSAWAGWEDAIAKLALRSLAPRVQAGYQDGRIGEGFSSWDEFLAELDRPKPSPEDARREAGHHLHDIDEVLESLASLTAMSDDAALDDEPGNDKVPPRAFEIPAPAHNPLRHVGRNDPCPCGSGKKAKRCCLAA